MTEPSLMPSPGYSIVAAEFNKPLVDAMVLTALEVMRACELPVARVLRVLGSYELPLVADRELERPEVGGLIVIGYIERGETLHGEVMGHIVSRSLVETQLRLKKPIGMGIIGPGATPEQAAVRHVASARAAVLALRRVVDLLS